LNNFRKLLESATGRKVRRAPSWFVSFRFWWEEVRESIARSFALFLP